MYTKDFQSDKIEEFRKAVGDSAETESEISRELKGEIKQEPNINERKPDIGKLLYRTAHKPGQKILLSGRVYVIDANGAYRRVKKLPRNVYGKKRQETA